VTSTPGNLHEQAFLRMRGGVRPPQYLKAAGRLGGAAALARSDSSEMEQMRRDQAEPHEADADDRDTTGEPGEQRHTGDDGRRAQHDADLECGGSELVIVVLRELGVAVVLRRLGALGQFDRAFPGFGLGTVARRSLLPLRDLLGDRPSVMLTSAAGCLATAQNARPGCAPSSRLIPPRGIAGSAPHRSVRLGSEKRASRRRRSVWVNWKPSGPAASRGDGNRGPPTGGVAPGCWEQIMPDYRIYLVTEDDHIASAPAKIACDNDLCTVRQSKKLLDRHVQICCLAKQLLLPPPRGPDRLERAPQTFSGHFVKKLASEMLTQRRASQARGTAFPQQGCNEICRPHEDAAGAARAIR
jgi:hypothetical protein